MIESEKAAVPPPLHRPSPSANGVALKTVALLCGISSILFSCAMGLGLIPGIAAIICGHKSSSLTGTKDAGTKAGIITGYIGTSFSILYLCLIGSMMLMGYDLEGPDMPSSGVG